LEVFCIALNRALNRAFWHIWQLSPGADNWSGWKSLEGPALKSMSAPKKEKQREEDNNVSVDVLLDNLHQSTEERMNGPAILG
jgi:hypothetical protein